MKKLLLSLVAILFAINAYAQPNTITYQGVLTNAGGAVLNGNYAIRFDICTGVNGVNSVWNETHNTVSVTNGLFQVELGSVTPFGSLNFSTPYWLEITVDPSGTNTTLSPRVAFNASNYSMAGKATSLQIASGAGTGKVLTSDANGNGSWAALNTSGLTFLTKDGSYTITAGDVSTDVYILNTASSNYNFTLPLASEAGLGRKIYLTNSTDQTLMNLITSDSDKIMGFSCGSGGVSNFFTEAGYRIFWIVLYSNGVDKWYILSSQF